MIGRTTKGISLRLVAASLLQFIAADMGVWCWPAASSGLGGPLPAARLVDGE
jgi:hypothetical protein